MNDKNNIETYLLQTFNSSTYQIFVEVPFLNRSFFMAINHVKKIIIYLIILICMGHVMF